MRRSLGAWAAGIGLIVLSAVGAGCKTTTFAMVPDPSVMFAKGEVDAEVTDEKNGTFTVSVEHLGDPRKINPSARTYVVWLQPRSGDAPIQNVGAIDVGSDYSGSHTFTSSFKEFDIAITPEERADVTKPTGRDVLKATISMLPKRPVP